MGYTNESSGIYNKGECLIFDDFTMDYKWVNFPFKIKSTAIKILTSKKDNLLFLYNMMQKMKFEPLGHNRHYINVVQNFNILVPYINEQQKIAKFFSLLDKQISLWERKLELYELFYKYYLNNLLCKYSKNEWKVPILRFKEFKDLEYYSYKSKDIFTITRGYVLSKKKVFSEVKDNNIFPVFSSQTENNGLMGFYNKYLYENALTWTTDGAKAGTFNYRNCKFYCTNVCGVILEKEFSPNYYFSELFNLIAHNFVIKELGNPKLMNNVVENIPLLIPKKSEISKINIFIKNNIDMFFHLKTILKNKKYIKNFYIKKMFI